MLRKQVAPRMSKNLSLLVCPLGFYMNGFSSYMWRKSFLLILLQSCSVAAQQAVFTDLDCDFDNQNFCLWANAQNNVEDDFDWRIDRSVAIDGFHSIPRTVTGTGYFAYAQGRYVPTQSGQAARAWLFSPPVDRLENPATLTFMYWKTAAPPVLQICTRDTGDNRLKCFDSISGVGDAKWNQRSVTIPSNTLPFQIIFVAVGFSTAFDLIGIDDITLRYANGERLGRVIIPAVAGAAAGGRYLAAPVGARGGQFSNDLNRAYPPAAPPGQPAFVQPSPPAAVQPYASQPSQNIAAYPQGDPSTGNVVAPPPGNAVHSRPQLGNVETATVAAANTEKSERVEPMHHGETNPNAVAAIPVENIEAKPSSIVVQPISEEHMPNTNSAPHLTHENVAQQQSAHNRPAEVATTTENCPSVDCPFNKDFCNWYNDLSANFDWKLKYTTLKGQDIGYIFANGDYRKFEQKASIKSLPFHVPRNVESFVDFLVFMSEPDAGRLSLIYHNEKSASNSQTNFQNGNNVVWQMIGYRSLGEEGWRRMRVPLPAVEFPVSLAFVADQLTVGQSIGVDDVRLTDRTGNNIACESYNPNAFANLQNPDLVTKPYEVGASIEPSHPSIGEIFTPSTSGLREAQIKEALIGDTGLFKKISSPTNDRRHSHKQNSKKNNLARDSLEQLIDDQSKKKGKVTANKNKQQFSRKATNPGVGTIVEESLPEIFNGQGRRLHDIQDRIKNKRKPIKYQRPNFPANQIVTNVSSTFEGSLVSEFPITTTPLIHDETFATLATDPLGSQTIPSTFNLNNTSGLLDADPLGFKDFVGLVGKDLQSFLQATGRALASSYNKNNNDPHIESLFPTIV